MMRLGRRRAAVLLVGLAGGVAGACGLLSGRPVRGDTPMMQHALARMVVLGGSAGRSGGASTLTLPRYLLDGTLSLIEPFDSAAEWSAASGTLSIADNTTPRELSQGTGGVKLTSSGAGAVTVRKTLGSPASMSDVAAHLRWDVFCHESNNVSRNLQITLWQTAGTKGRIFTQGIGRVGWNTLQVSKSAATIIGGMATTDPINVIDVTFNFQGASQSLTLDNLLDGYSPVPSAAFAFHDTWASFYTDAYPLFQARGLKATLVLNTAGSVAPGAANRMTYPQINEIVNTGGWTAVNHGTAHLGYPTFADQAAIETDMASARDTLIANGLPSAQVSQYISYPNAGGGIDAKTLAAATALGYVIGHGHSEPTNMPIRWPVPDLQQHGFQVITGGLAANLGRADAVLALGGTMFWVSHNVATSGGEITPGDLASLLDYLVLNRVPCLTYDELYRLQSGPITIEVPW